jgi:isoaspartyl peptidase/L-asparaginase-like protein (Ntn-hydrolase superfamily)
MIINGDTMQMGSVGFLSGVKDAIGVAYEVYRRTEMTLLAGAGATGFAKEMQFQVLPNLGEQRVCSCRVRLSHFSAK